ncbi:MAG: cyclic nucleotide-binding domain-containing protein, partial [Hyphomicrobiales bacterium]
LRGRALRDLSILLAVMLGILLVHPTMGVLIGVVLSCLLFITDMARPMIVARGTGATLLSRRGRSAHDMDLLRQYGGRTLVLRLQGVLFFGNGDDLDTELRRLEPQFDTVILDMRRVSDIDATGNKLLNDMSNRLAKNGRSLCIAGLTPELALFLGQAIQTAPDLDAALERFEEKSLGEGVNSTLAQDDLEFLATLPADRREVFARAIEHRDYAAGDVLCRLGDPGDGMWIVLTGSISVRVQSTSGALRVAGIASGAPAGELALLEGSPRSADLVADGALQTLYLSTSAFETLSHDAPDIGQAIITWIAVITAQRLRSSSEALRFAASE